MNFQNGGKSGSFRDSAAYFLHDKAEQGQPKPTTADRVAWTTTRNLMDVGPHTATRVMIRTAESANDLKREAGIKASGRKSRDPVYTFSLNWHPDEKPTREQMVEAADGALKVMGLDHLQAVLIAHHDTDHQHVHIMVNRIDPLTGKTTVIDKARFHALDEFCHHTTAPEHRHLSPERAAKYAAKERGKKIEPDPAKRKEYAEKKRLDREAAAPKSDAEKQHRADRQRRKDQHDDRKRIEELPRSKASIDTAAIKAQWQADMRPPRERNAAQVKSEWRTFHRNERELFGGLVNAIKLAQRCGLSEKSEFWPTVGRLWTGGKDLRAETLRQLHKNDRQAFNDRAFANLRTRYKAAWKAVYTAKREEIRIRTVARNITKKRHAQQDRKASAYWKTSPPRTPKQPRTAQHVKGAWQTAATGPATTAKTPMGMAWQESAKAKPSNRPFFRKPDHGPDGPER